MARTKSTRGRDTTPRTRAGAATAKRTVSPDTALKAVMRLAASAGVAKALGALETILAARPDHWPTIKYRWELLWTIGHVPAAMAAGGDALARAARLPATQENLACHFLGVALAKVRENPKYAPHLGSVIELTIGLAGQSKMSGLLHVALQNALGAVGRHAEGLKLGIEGADLYPDYAPVFHHNNSFHLFELGRHEDAVAEFGRKLVPFSGKARRAKAAGPRDPQASNDESNVATMAQLIVKTAGATVNKRILDAGCGAGFLGTRIRAAHLAGIDPSPKMLARARARNLYQELIKGDPVAEMTKRKDRSDIIVATGVLCYVADLTPFFRQAARLLVPGGYLFFTTDPAPDAMDIGIGGPGEYAHSRAYVRRLAAKTGFTEIAVRIMPHRGNPGFWWAFRRLT